MTQTRMLAFTGARGDRLAGRLDMPDGKPRAVVLVAHCFGDGNAGPVTAQFARGFTELGMAVLSLDCGPGDAPGLDDDDLAIAAGELRAAVAAPGVLVGHARAGVPGAPAAAQGRLPGVHRPGRVRARPAGMAGRGHRGSGQAMTFSLAGRCERTGALGAVIASASMAVAARCVAVRAGRREPRGPAHRRVAGWPGGGRGDFPGPFGWNGHR